MQFPAISGLSFKVESLFKQVSQDEVAAQSLQVPDVFAISGSAEEESGATEGSGASGASGAAAEQREADRLEKKRLRARAWNEERRIRLERMKMENEFLRSRIRTMKLDNDRLEARILELVHQLGWTDYRLPE